MGNTTVKTTDDDTDQDDAVAAGSATDDSADRSTDTTDAADDDDEEDEEEAEAAILATLSPAAVALFEKTRDQLAKANASSRNRRAVIKALRAGKQVTDPKVAKPGPAKTEGVPAAFDPEAFMAQVRAELKGEQDATRVQTAAERELKRAGLVLPEDPAAAERKLSKVLRMLDLDGVTPDEVADEVADLKADSPELFGRAVFRRPKTGGVGGPATIKGAAKGTGVDALFD